MRVIPFLGHREFLSCPATVFQVAVCLAAMTILTACQNPAPAPESRPRPVKFFEVGTSDATATWEFFGAAKASENAELSFRFGGRLVEFPVQQGQRVEEGDLIARLDPREWQSRVAQIESELDAQRSVLGQMRAGARQEDIRRLESLLVARETEFEDAKTRLERMRSLYEEEVISQDEYDRIRVQANAAQANYDSALQELEVARTGARLEEIAAQEAAIRGLEARLAQARDDLDETVMRAPFTGTIARTNASNFEDVQANQVVAVLQDLTRMEVVINVPERAMVAGLRRVELQPDEEIAFATVPAVSDEQYPVRVKEFQTEANPATQTFEVVFQMDQPPGSPIRPGMNVVIRGEGSPAGEGFMVPASAITSAPNGTNSVWVVDPATGAITRRQVTTGMIWEDAIAVLDGLNPGEIIAASAVHLLSEGDRVVEMQNPGEL